MSNTNASQTPPNSPNSTNSKPSKARRTRASDADLLRAQQVAAALPPLLRAIAAKDANAAKVRIDQAWVDQYEGLIASVQEAEGTRGVATLDLRAATEDERQKGLELSLVLTDVRELVATHNPDDLAAQQAYGRGEKIDPRRTRATAAIAGAYLAAWDGKWKQPAVDAGVTQGTMDRIQSLRDALSQADIAQHGVVSTNEDGTVNRAAAIAALRQMTAFAVKVVTNVFGRGSSQLRSLANPRPLTSRAGTRKAATKAKHAAAKSATKAKKAAKLAKPGARAATAKGRGKRAAVKAKAQALLSKPKAAAKAKKAKAAKTKRPAKKAKRRG